MRFLVRPTRQLDEVIVGSYPAVRVELTNSRASAPDGAESAFCQPRRRRLDDSANRDLESERFDVDARDAVMSRVRRGKGRSGGRTGGESMRQVCSSIAPPLDEWGLVAPSPTRIMTFRTFRSVWDARTMAIDLRHFRSFVAVAEEGGIGRAADRLFMTQPALSRQIQQLEREIGEPLLLRVPHGVELTPTGRELLDKARAAIEAAEAALAVGSRSSRTAGWCSGCRSPAGGNDGSRSRRRSSSASPQSRSRCGRR